MGLERYFTEQRDKLTAYKFKDIETRVKLRSICRRVADHIMPWRSVRGNHACPIYTYVVRRRNQKGVFNPIQVAITF